MNGKEKLVIGLLAAALAATGAYFGTVSATSTTVAVAPAEPDVPAHDAVVPTIPATELAALASTQPLKLRSQIALVMDEKDGVTLFDQRADQRRPIASITKLMTALVVLEAGLPADELIEITRADRDRIKGTRSRLHFGTVLTRQQLLRAALAASDNRAAAALARTYPGGTAAALATMNAKAAELGMSSSHFADAAGLSAKNVSTARDLAKLLEATRRQPLIADLSTSGDFSVVDYKSSRVISFLNTNRLLRGETWDIRLSKTGYTADAGNCLVLKADIAGRPMTIVLLNSWGKLSKYGDAQRIREWLLKAEQKALRMTAQAAPTL